MSLLTFERSLLNVFLRSVNGEVKREARLTVKGNGERNAVFLHLAFIVSGPSCVANAASITHAVPKFFCNVRSEGSKEHYHSFKHFLVITLLLREFVHRNHEGYN